LFAGVVLNWPELDGAPGSRPPDDPHAALCLAHERFGESLARRIEGSASFVVQPVGGREGLAVADRLGQHPIFFRESNQGPQTALAVQALVGERDARRIDAETVATFLMVASRPRGKTFWRDVGRLEAGEAAVVAAGGLRVQSYWSPANATAGVIPDADFAGELRNLLGRVVGQYERACQPPVGLTLSSGLDSGSIAAALNSPGAVLPLHFSSPEVLESDETALARAVAFGVGMPAGIVVRMDANGPFAGDSLELSASLDGPRTLYYVEAWTAMLALAGQAGVRTVFTGLGGDELFGGVVFGYGDLLLAGQVRPLVHLLGQHVPASSLGLPLLLWRHVLGPLLSQSLQRRRSRVARVDGSPWIARRLVQSVADAQVPSGWQRRRPSWSRRLEQAGQQAASWEIAELTQLGRRLGLEIVHPLLDRRLVEFAVSLPAWEACRGGIPKRVLREAFAHRLPRQVVDARGYVVPAAIYRREIADRQSAKVWNLLTDMRAADLGFVSQSLLRSAYARFQGGEDLPPTFWRALCLEAWLRRVFS
jgi:asparagine synthase (glutamine-hydrolysing)